jgi:hypothetical protein
MKMWWGHTLVCYREVTLVTGGDRFKRHVLTSGSGNASVWGHSVKRRLTGLLCLRCHRRLQQWEVVPREGL